MFHRIVRHAEFQSFINAGQSCQLPHFYVPVLKEENSSFAFGITISAKIGNAVQRNFLKRRIKAWFYEYSTLLPNGIKVNLIARKGAAELDWDDLCRELSQLISLLKQ